MITGLRSAIICQKVERLLDGQINVIGVRPDRMIYEQRPALDTFDLFLTVDFDGKGATGFVRLDAPQFAHRVPFATPAGITSSGMFFTLMLPVVEHGQFVVSVVDGANRTKPFKAKWAIDFAPNAAELGQEKAADLVRTCNEETANMLSALHGRRSETH